MQKTLLHPTQKVSQRTIMNVHHPQPVIGKMDIVTRTANVNLAMSKKKESVKRSVSAVYQKMKVSAYLHFYSYTYAKYHFSKNPVDRRRWF